MNYKRIYDSIIENRKVNKIHGYTENHHIIPDSLGGSNDKENMVRLTAKEHFICHLLLTKMYEKGTNEYYKMIKAFHMMSVISECNIGRYITSRNYSHLKEDYSSIMSTSQKGESNSQYGTIWIHNIITLKAHKIKKSEPIQSGFAVGRTPKIVKTVKEKKCKNINHTIKRVISVKTCKYCGALQYKCIKPEICKRVQITKCFLEYMHFDKSCLGNINFYDEYNRIVDMLRKNYNHDMMSIEDIKNLYNLTSNERVRKLFVFLDIDRRTLSESVKNYSYKKVILHPEAGERTPNPL